MIFLAFIFIPIIEISIFITIGSKIGILNTVSIILLTAIIGIYFVRRQGLNLLFNAQKNLSEGIMPTEEIKGGIFLLISGLLLITPGFFTDCIGFAMFLKPVQNFVALREDQLNDILDKPYKYRFIILKSLITNKFFTICYCVIGIFCKPLFNSNFKYVSQ